MRKSSAHGGELHTNDSLCVSGRKIELLKAPEQPCCLSNRNIRLEDSLEEVADEVQPRKRPDADKRRAFKLKVTEYRNSQACSKQLRQIYETVEVEDFERILASFRASRQFRRQARPGEHVLEKIDAAGVYDEFFGRYYQLLRGTASDDES